MKDENRKRKVIEEICKEKEIEIEDISYDWISILKKGDKERKIINNCFYINSQKSDKLAKDKYSTYSVLSYYNIPIIKHEVIFNEKVMQGVTEINRNFECIKNNKKQVIKQIDSSQGKNVYLSESEDEKKQIVDQLFDEDIEGVVVCPYIEIDYEYRAIFLDGKIIYIYKKEKPFVVGDGISSIGELIKENLKYLEVSIENINFNDIPKENEKVIVGWKHNLCNGAIPIIIDSKDEFYDCVKEIALKAGEALELTYATIDIAVTKDKEVMVMEVNSNVCITKFCELVPNGYEIQKEILAKVIDKMFED